MNQNPLQKLSQKLEITTSKYIDYVGYKIRSNDIGSVQVMKEKFILERENLLPIHNKALLYPCSGNDFDVAIFLFSPLITDFWFVDRGYFSPNHQDTRGYKRGLDAPADEQIPLLKGHPDYQFMGKKIVGSPTWYWRDYDIDPCVLTEIYLHVPSNRKIKIHRRRGYGISAFHKERFSLGVFFYRGDSQGEGGSGNLWLHTRRIHEICDKLVDGGLIVTDGSQHSYKQDHVYKELWKYRSGECPPTAEEIIKSARPFTDPEGRHFTCIGYAGHRYGPTLVWQVRKSGPDHPTTHS